MRIGGFVPCSLSDFPGRLAAVVFTQGCNWRCPWCHNPSLVYPDKFGPALDEATLWATLQRRVGKLDGVVVSGGEPTLHADLPDFLRKAKQLGFQTKLDTNGSRPHIVRQLLNDSLVDFVAMDIKAPWGRYAEAAGTDVSAADLQETVALLRERGVEHQLRTTLWPGLTERDRKEISHCVSGSPHVWQDYRPPQAG